MDFRGPDTITKGEVHRHACSTQLDSGGVALVPGWNSDSLLRLSSRLTLRNTDCFAHERRRQLSSASGQLARHGEQEPALGRRAAWGHGGPGSRSFLFLTCASAAQCNPHPLCPITGRGWKAGVEPGRGRGRGGGASTVNVDTRHRGGGDGGLAVPSLECRRLSRASLVAHTDTDGQCLVDGQAVSRPSCPAASTQTQTQQN